MGYNSGRGKVCKSRDKILENIAPSKAISEIIKTCDLVVLGIRWGYKRRRFGQVAEGIMGLADKPCLMICYADN